MRKVLIYMGILRPRTEADIMKEIRKHLRILGINESEYTDEELKASIEAFADLMSSIGISADEATRVMRGLRI